MLVLRDISVSIGVNTLFNPFSLAVDTGEIVTVMGPSGSGKSTLLGCIGGDVSSSFKVTGDITLNGASLLSVPAEKRKIARLFQDDLLFPHMTIEENLLFAVPDLPKAERKQAVKVALQRADLQGYENRSPHTLSGGQRQRVALMRALLANPSAVLLDEPFSKLDKALKAQMRNEVFSHIRARNIPALLVTHDLSDAPASGRVLEIRNGGVHHV